MKKNKWCEFLQTA